MASWSLVTQENPIYEIPAESLPSAPRWIDGRTFEASLAQSSNKAFIYIAPKGDVDYYNSMMEGPCLGGCLYHSLNYNGAEIPTMFAFNKG